MNKNTSNPTELHQYALVDITLPPAQQAAIDNTPHHLTEAEANDLNYARALNGNSLRLIKVDINYPYA